MEISDFDKEIIVEVMNTLIKIYCRAEFAI